MPYRRKQTSEEDIGKIWDRLEKECKEEGLDPYRPMNLQRK